MGLTISGSHCRTIAGDVRVVAHFRKSGLEFRQPTPNNSRDRVNSWPRHALSGILIFRDLLFLDTNQSMDGIHSFPISGVREPFCSLSHLVGASVFAALSVASLERGRGDRVRFISLAVMAVATVQTLVVSSIYHTLWPGWHREFMLRADVAGIFLLIAGSITPVHAILFRGWGRWMPLILIWSVALGGMVLRILYFDTLPNWMGIPIFLGLGWGCAITAAVVWQRFGWRFIRAGILAGLAYTVGAIVLATQRPILMEGLIGPHELWHVAVLCGLGLHWHFVFQFAAGMSPDAEIQRSQRIIHIGPPHLSAAMARSSQLGPPAAERPQQASEPER